MRVDRYFAQKTEASGLARRHQKRLVGTAADHKGALDNRARRAAEDHTTSGKKATNSACVRVSKYASA